MNTTTLFEITWLGDVRQLTDANGKPFSVRQAELRTVQSYAQSFAVICFDKVADEIPPTGTLVWAELGFTVRQHDGRRYQDVTLRHFRKI